MGEFISNASTSIVGILFFLIVNIVIGLFCFLLYKMFGE